MARLLVTDVGNTKNKTIAGHIRNRFSFPNIIAKAPADRRLARLEGDLLSNLHFRVNSPVLPHLNGGIFAAGHLAIRDYNDRSREILPDSDKCLNEQSILMILLNAAIDAVQTHKTDIKYIESEHTLAVPIPLKELKTQGMAESLQKKLQNYVHEIEFLQVPEVGGIKVRLAFDKVQVFGEGLTAIYALGMPIEDNPPLIPDIFDLETVVLTDIGGGSSEVVMLENGNIHNRGTDGDNRLGGNRYLDQILHRVYNELGADLKTRFDVLKRIERGQYDIRVIDKELGREVSKKFKYIVDEEFAMLAQMVYDKLIYPSWQQVTQVDLTAIIGGGSLAVKEALQKISPRDLFFVDDPDLTIWLNAVGAFLMLQDQQ